MYYVNEEYFQRVMKELGAHCYRNDECSRAENTIMTYTTSDTKKELGYISLTPYSTTYCLWGEAERVYDRVCGKGSFKSAIGLTEAIFVDILEESDGKYVVLTSHDNKQWSGGSYMTKGQIACFRDKLTKWLGDGKNE